MGFAVQGHVFSPRQCRRDREQFLFLAALSFLALWIIYTKLIADDHPLTGLQEVRWHHIFFKVELCPANQLKISLPARQKSLNRHPKRGC